MTTSFLSGSPATTCKKIDLAPPYAWTRAASLAFALATAYALAVVAFRLPAWQADHREAFRVALLLHVNLAVFVWLVLTMAGQWAHSLGTRATWPLRAGVVGTLLIAAAPLAGGVPVMADYFPWLAGNPLFAAGFALVSAGVLALAVQRLWRAAEDKDVALRLAAWPTVFAALSALTARLNGADGMEVAWAAGHVLLFAHVAMLCHEWTVHGVGEARRARRAGWVLVIVSATLVVLPWVFEPGSAAYRRAYSWAMIGVLWMPALDLALGLRRSFRAAQSPVSRLSLVLSLTLFVLGCLLGLLIAIDGRPTTLVTAHYHAAIGAVAISRMGMAYLQVIPLAEHAVRWPRLRNQLAVYASALLLLTAGLTLAAVERAPRKTSAAELTVKGPWYRAGMTVAGVGGTLAMVGTVWLLINLRAGGRRPTGLHRMALPGKKVANEL